jgi:hypothetical protein
MIQPGAQDVDRLASILQPYPASEMQAAEANEYVNNARREGPECLAGPGCHRRISDQ